MPSSGTPPPCRLHWHNSGNAQKQGEQLAQIRVRLDKQSELLSKDINHAIEQDKNSGHDCAGIGTNSLHLYNRAFGYSN